MDSAIIISQTSISIKPDKHHTTCHIPFSVHAICYTGRVKRRLFHEDRNSQHPVPKNAGRTSPLRRKRLSSASAILEQSFRRWNINRRISCGWSSTTLPFLKLTMNPAGSMLFVCSRRIRQIRLQILFTAIGKIAKHCFASAIMASPAVRRWRRPSKSIFITMGLKFLPMNRNGTAPTSMCSA